MGIPNFSRDLGRHGESVILGEPIAGDARPVVQSIVIDGPGLVYHVYYRLLACTSPTLDPLYAQPSCREISDGVHRFLLELCEQGIKMYVTASDTPSYSHDSNSEQIYFDGALPTAKRSIRSQRLERERLKLQALHKSYEKLREGLENRPVFKKVSSDADLFSNSKTLPTKFSRLPTPPFMVPAVIESLQNLPGSRFASPEESFAHVSPNRKGEVRLAGTLFRVAVRVVPGEADEDCAAHSRRTGAVILTNDSDLLAYNLGEKGSVIKLNTLERSTDNALKAEEGLISGTRWRPSKISQQLNLNGLNLTRLAHARRRDPYASFATILHRSRQPLSGLDAEDFTQFMMEYSMRPGDAEEDYALSGFDPRVSELFLQFKHPKYLTSPLVPIAIYLPVLTESPARTSSWTYGAQIRRLAYSVLNLSSLEVHQRGQLIEHRRRGSRIAAVDVKLFSLEKTVAELRSLGQYFQRLGSLPYAQTKSSAFWYSVGFREVSQSLIADGKLPISQEWTMRFLCSEETEPYSSWDDIHAYANAQAVLYSFRILKQLLYAAKSSVLGKVQASVGHISLFLDNLPDLSCLMSSRRRIPGHTLNDKSIRAMIHELYRLDEHGIFRCEVFNCS